MRWLIDRLRFARDHRWVRRHLSEYLDDELDPVGRERTEHHARDCVECDELLGSLRTMLKALGTIGGEPGRAVAATVFAGVHDRLAAGGRDDQLV